MILQKHSLSFYVLFGTAGFVILLSEANDKSIFCRYHLCVLLTGEAAFSRLEKVRIDGGALIVLKQRNLSF